MRVIYEPCYFAEAIYLLHAFVNHISFEDEYNRVSQYFGHHSLTREENLARSRIGELTRIMEGVTCTMNPEDERLQYFFAYLPGTDKRSACSLAQTMLITVPLDRTRVDDFADELLRGYGEMMRLGVKVNDLNTMGLVLEQWDDRDEMEPLANQLERLPCDLEGKWRLLRALTDYEHHVRELTELIRPVASRLEEMMAPLVEMNAENFQRWIAYFQQHTMDDFQNEMFNTTFLFPENNSAQETWLGIWYFNFLGVWSEWIDNRSQSGTPIRLAYIGMSISFDFAARYKKMPDTETLCAMLKALGGKDKLETLRLCAEQPISAARLAEAMHLNSGTVSRNLYGLYKLGFLETKGDGERVNYQTKMDSLQQLFGWITAYVEGQ